MIEILKYKAIGKGALIASFSIKLVKNGNMIISNCTLFESNGKRWISLPSKEYEEEGKKKYVAYVYFEDKAINDRFKEAIMCAVTEYQKKQSATVIATPEDNEPLPF